MGAIQDALRQRFKTPHEVLEKLGLGDSAATLLARDSKGTSEMAKQPIKLSGRGAMLLGSLTSYLKPRLAADAKISLAPLLVDITSKNFSEKKTEVIDKVKKAVKGKLAKDANIDSLLQLLNALEGSPGEVMGGPEEQPTPIAGGGEGGGAVETEEDNVMPQHDLQVDPNMGGPTGVPHPITSGQQVTRDAGHEELMQFLASKGMSPEDIQEACSIAHGPGGEPGGGGGMGGGGEPPMDTQHHGMSPHGMDGPGESTGGHEGYGTGGEADAFKTAADMPPEFEGMPHPGGHVGGDNRTRRAMDARKKVARQAMDMAAELKTLDQKTQRAIKLAVDGALMAAKKASDQQIKEAKEDAIRTQKEIREAENVVRPWVGQMEMAFDGASDVYRTALQALGVKDLDIVHPSAYKTILELQPLPGASRGSRYAQDSVAMDSATTVDFFKRFPGAAKIGRVA
jgi:hypothetical protein